MVFHLGEYGHKANQAELRVVTLEYKGQIAQFKATARRMKSGRRQNGIFTLVLRSFYPKST